MCRCPSPTLPSHVSIGGGGVQEALKGPVPCSRQTVRAFQANPITSGFSMEEGLACVYH